MARSVTLTNRILTLEEFGDRIGLSKARQRALAPIFVERRPDGSFAIRRRGSIKPSAVVPTQKEAVERARALSPESQILVERVRGTTVGASDKWRRA